MKPRRSPVVAGINETSSFNSLGLGTGTYKTEQLALESKVDRRNATNLWMMATVSSARVG